MHEMLNGLECPCEIKKSNDSFNETRSGRSSTASIFRLLLFSLSTVIINKCRVMNWHRLLLLGYFRQSSLVVFFLLVERARELAQYLEIHVLSIFIISLFLLESLPIASLSYGGWISLSSPTLLMTLVNLQIRCFILRKTGVNLQDGHCFFDRYRLLSFSRSLIFDLHWGIPDT